MLYANYTDVEAGELIEKEILSLFRRYPSKCYPFKLTDTKAASSGNNLSYVQPVPSDLIVTLKNGVTVYVEIKSSRVHQTIWDAMGNIRNIQAASARRITKLDGYYYFILVDRVNKTIMAYEGKGVSRYYHKKSKETFQPKLSGSWAKRLSFIEGFIDRLA